ncbi:DUF6994 family protein [Pseudarthrobacter sp. S9]|uniref:DUF6994 family protein n=1 Tax=Pseudarthrobacter sp. S9 TaxID=3418421 RepID=UPI003D01753F
MRRVFDTTFDYKTDKPARTRPDADRDSPQLRADHELLWTKELRPGELFEPKAPAVRRKGYLIFTNPTSEEMNWYGSDAITNSYTSWLRPKTLVKAIADLDKDQRALNLNPPYTIGSAMIWPVRKKDPYTMNRARVRRQIGDRMDLTLECIRRHYAGEQWSPLAKVIKAYEDFFALFRDFKGFVEFFHFQDLVSPDYDEVQFFLPLENFRRHGAPATTPEYVTYRDKVLEFIAARNSRMAEWVIENHPDIEVRQ